MIEINSPVIGPVSLSMQLDQGGFGNVWRGYSINLNATIAIKFCNKDSGAEREFRYGQLINHPLALQCFSYYSAANKCIGLMPCLEGLNLRELVNKNGPFPEMAARIIMIELVSVLDYLHNELEMIHRDIKLENVIIDRNGNAHLIDFGFLAPPEQKTGCTAELCGTPKYISPELIKSNTISFSNDIWSLGVLLYTIMMGHFPFIADSSTKELYDQICHHEVQFTQQIDPSLKDLICRMLEKDPTKRITLAEIMKHPWINPVINGVQKFANFEVLKNLRILPLCPNQIDHEIVNKICQQCKVDEKTVESEVLQNRNTFNVVMYKMERLKSIEPYLENITTKIFGSDVQSSSVLPRIGMRKTLTFNHQQRMAKQIKVEVRQKARTRLILPGSRCAPKSCKPYVKPIPTGK